MRLLSHFLDILFPPRDTEALVRSATVEDLMVLMRPITHTISGHRVTTLLPYRHALVRAAVIEAKFKGNAQATKLLGAVLREYLYRSPSVVLVPTPLGERRLRERGYNQVEEIMKAAQATPAAHLLTRTKETLPQTELSGRTRHRNIGGAFRASTCDPERTYIVFDDVTTTGATLRDAARALKEADAIHVEFVALAH